MKTIVLIVTTVLMINSIAFAQNNGGHNGNKRGDRGFCGASINSSGHYGEYYGKDEYSINSSDEAVKKVEEYMSELKLDGHKVTNSAILESRQGRAVYEVLAVDSSGNEMVYRVWSNGRVRGPVFKNQD